MKRRAYIATGFLTAALHLGCAPQSTEQPGSTLSVASLLGSGTAEGFERAIAPREFRFPEDHGPHEGFQTEWWYYTGNLDTASGDRLGYQLTFFKAALTASPATRSSKWATDQVFMGHFAITDGERQRFEAHERFARRAVGLAGAQGAPFRVWLEDWSARAVSGGMRLTAAAGEIAIDLTLAEGKAPVLQGEDGLSRKGSGDGNASYYYSLTRLPTTGSVTIGSDRFEVEGLSWMDREWSTSVLEEGQVGWDWFSLQLDDERELMVYRIRRDDGSADRHSAGTMVDAEGRSRTLSIADWTLEELDSWTSPDGTRYPARWRITVPSEELELKIEPLVADQELRHTFRYWEGAVTATGSSGGEPIDGRGYVEMTGY